MFYQIKNSQFLKQRLQYLTKFKKGAYSTNNIPAQADVVVIGGGVAGCNITYQLSKRGMKVVLLERGKITNGTTWHTGGLIWRLSRPFDVDIKLLEASRNIYSNLEQETGQNPGFIVQGGLFIARTDERIQEYKKLHTFAHYFNVDTHLISPKEAADLSPVLDPSSFKAALYSPGDGYIDPTMLCNALLKGAKSRGAQVFEQSEITGFNTEPVSNIRKISGVKVGAEHVIKTSCVVNSCGVWSRELSQLLGLDIPISVMKHSYIVTDSIPEVKGTPCIRDHDGNIYIKVQGDTLHIGGYENNPELVKEVPSDFNFSLYDFNKDIFHVHMENTKQIIPKTDEFGIKSEICGPESFTPDHKPIIGEDPKMIGLFYNCGFNSGGMQLSGGCSEQLAIWISQGRPELPMYTYDMRRFTTSERNDRVWILETSHESYAKNYDIVFPRDQRLAGRNHKTDAFHEALVARGAVMEQMQGWERPSYYIKDRTAPVKAYDWYGHYDHNLNTDKRYEEELWGDRTFGFSKHHHLIGEEALAVRNSVGVFDLSSLTKMYLTGPDAQEAADWLFTADTDSGAGSVTYSCTLNSKGGIEGDVIVTQLTEGVGTLVGPILKGKGYYIVVCGEAGYQTMSHIRRELIKKNFKATIIDTTNRMGILSLQGPKSGELLQSMTETPITDDKFPLGMSQLIKIGGHICRAVRMSFVGEYGFQLHIPFASCIPIYNRLIEAGRGFELEHVGFRAFHSLSCEKGYHLWKYDIRSNDNPIEAGLGAVCRTNGQYLGKHHVDKLKVSGCKRKRAFFTVQNDVPLHGMETIWRDDRIVGYLRRGDYGYSLDCSIGVGYVEHPNGKIVDDEFLQSGKYEIEVTDKRYPATLFLNSPFDPTNARPLGQYESNFQEQSHFED